MRAVLIPFPAAGNACLHCDQSWSATVAADCFSGQGMCALHVEVECEALPTAKFDYLFSALNPAEVFRTFRSSVANAPHCIYPYGLDELDVALVSEWLKHAFD